jgi:plastocyanin
MRLAVVVALVACAPVVRAAPPAPAPAPAPAATPAKPDPVSERAQAITEAGSLLEKANAARLKGNKNFAEQLFSSVEIILGPDALAEIAPLFREGAPPRVTTPLKQLPKDSAPQPVAVGSSDEEEPPKPEPKRGSLAGTLSASGDKPLGGRGVITLEPVGVKWKARPPKDRVMEQRNREFAPKVLVVRLGSTVSFPNFDTVYHNVFSRSDARAFDLGIYKNGQTRELTFDKEGIVRLGCNLHANMSGYIVVVNAPHYAITDDKGAFKFRSLPPGKYKLKAWGEKSVSPTVREVTIAASDNTVKVALEGDTAPSVDKFGVPRGK